MNAKQTSEFSFEDSLGAERKSIRANVVPGDLCVRMKRSTKTRARVCAKEVAPRQIFN